MQQIQNGQCVFFQEFQVSAHRKSMKVKVKHLAFGVLLGALPPFAKDPTPADLYRCMGQIGYMSFDDVAEFLGPEAGQKCVEMFEKKYYAVAPKVPAPPTEGEAVVEGEVPPKITQEGVADLLDNVEATEVQEPSRLVNINGTPFKKD